MALQHDSERPLLLDTLDYNVELPGPKGEATSWRDTCSFFFGKFDPLYIVRCSKQASKSFLYAFVPQFVRTIVFDDPEQSSEAISSTAWLNGLRGFAALAVFNFHFLYSFTYTIGDGYGLGDNNRWIHQIPVFYLFYDGATSVMIFFTIAGYVGSYKALQHMTVRDHDSLFKSMPASAFRKWFRLYLPVMCSTLIISSAAYLGLLESSRYLYDQETDTPLKKYFHGIGGEPQFARLPSLHLQLRKWISQVSQIMAFWTEFPFDPDIDFHLWTIVYEFRSCMQLFVVLLALARCTPRIRIGFLLLLGFVFMVCWEHYESLCFFWGAALAQFQILRLSSMSQGDTTDISTRKPSFRHSVSTHCRRVLNTQVVRILGYCLALYLASFPMQGDEHGGGIFYAQIVDPLLPEILAKNKRHKLPKQIAVLLFMFLLLTIPTADRTKSRWHRLLTSSFALYLGKVMFALYLMHGLILHVVGYGIAVSVWRSTSSTWDEDIGILSVTNNTEFLFGMFTGWSISLVLVLWAADVFEREVERRCTRLTKWIESACFETDEPLPLRSAASAPSRSVSTNGQDVLVKVQ